jgi:hypothetical protein
LFFFQLFIIFAPVITNLDFTSMFNKQTTTMKKRLLLLFSALAVVVAFTALTACGDDDNDDNGNEPSYYMCTKCNGTGKIECELCKSTGICSFCNGDGTCDLCNGYGHIDSYWDNTNYVWVEGPVCIHLGATVLDLNRCACINGTCYPCSGSGYWECPNCQGKGYIGDYPGDNYGGNSGGGSGGGNDNYDDDDDDDGDSGGGDSGGGDRPKTCRWCMGSGDCRETGASVKACWGDGECRYCLGTGWNSWYDIGCTYCDRPGDANRSGNGKCGFCGGSGKCQHCGGTGHKN